jgi:hypothetical protein
MLSRHHQGSRVGGLDQAVHFALAGIRCGGQQNCE